MAEKIFDAQVNYGWGLSLNMTGKAPAVAKRIFDKYEDALAYANDVNDSAIEGLVLSVVADTDVTKNGLYFVKQVATKEIEEVKDEEGNVTTEAVPAKEAILVKISTNADSQATADEVQELLNAEISARTESDKVLSGAIDTNAAAIEVLSGAIVDNKSAVDADIEALSGAIVDNKSAVDADIEALSGAIDTNAAAIEVLSGAIDTNKASLDVVSGLAETNKTDIATVSGQVKNLLDVAIPELQGDIADNAEAISAITTSYKIKEVAEGDKVLTVDANGKLASTLGITYDSTNKKINLVGVNGETIGESVDASDFIKDGMLSGVTLVQEGSKEYLQFVFNTDAGQDTINVDVTKFLNGTELANLEASLSAHTASTTVHFTGEEKAKFTDLVGTYSKTQLDAKFTEISNAFTANTQAHTDLSAEIASAKTDIATVSGDVKTNKEAISALTEDLAEHISANTEAFKTVNDEIDALASANTEAHTALSSAVSANAEAIEELSKEIDDLVSANTTAHETLQNKINKVEEDYKAADSALTQSIETLESANTEAHEALSGAVSANTEAIENLDKKVDDLVSANTEAHTTLQNKINKVEEDYKAADSALTQSIETLGQKVTENEEVASAAINDLKANKVSSVVAEENSNIVVTETKDENGISYTIGFQWLEF